jgi:hypothetical protein
LKNTYCTFLLSQIHDVCDAVVREISLMTGNRFELARSIEASSDKSVDAEITKEIFTTNLTRSSAMAKPSRELKKEISSTEVTEVLAPRKKRISDISQMRLDAYVARSAEQDEKKKHRSI